MAYSPFNLSGKVALVTGGNGGIGLGSADALAQAGADICIWGRNDEKNQAAVEQLKQHGTKVHAIVCDVADESAVETSFAETLSVMGRVDTCFANAGVGGGGRSPFHERTSEQWHRVTSVNLDGLFYTLRAAAKHMVERSQQGDPGGRLIATSSLAAIMGMARAEHYAATKGAVISMMQALAIEYARHGITAHSILPGHIHTGMTDATYQNEKFVDAVMPRIPMRRWGKPEDFGGIAVYLASDASAYHTAETFLIDGGFFMF
ncbi:SDR family oxidoreductase [Aurantivibrio plasticivorans]